MSSSTPSRPLVDLCQAVRELALTDSASAHELGQGRLQLLNLDANKSVRALIEQAVMTHLYLGIAEGAFEEARRHTLAQSRPWGDRGVLRAADQSAVQRRFGDLWLYVRPAQVVVEATVLGLQAALGPALTHQQLDDLVVAGAEAQLLARRAALEVSTQVFELTGQRRSASFRGRELFLRSADAVPDAAEDRLFELGRYQLRQSPAHG